MNQNALKEELKKKRIQLALESTRVDFALLANTADEWQVPFRIFLAMQFSIINSAGTMHILFYEKGQTE